MTFPEALEELHNGNSVQRAYWGNENTYIKKNSLGILEFCDFEETDEVLFTSDDVLATDWVVV